MTNAFMGKSRHIGGARYVLGYTFADLIDLEEDHKDIMHGVVDHAKLTTARYVRDLIAKGLKGQVPDADAVTLLIVELGGMSEALTWFGEAIAVAYGAGDGEPVPPRNAQPAA